jgi:hypothetical protein
MRRWISREMPTIPRKLLLAKVSVPVPNNLEDQLAGEPSHKPHTTHRVHAETMVRL